MFILQQKNKFIVKTKCKDVTKQGFCKILWRKLRLRGSLLLVLIQFWGGVRGKGVGWGGRLFEAGRLLTFSAFRMGAYSRWALIRGWALIQINTVNNLMKNCSNLHYVADNYNNCPVYIMCGSAYWHVRTSMCWPCVRSACVDSSLYKRQLAVQMWDVL